MTTELKLPKLAEKDTTGTVARVTVRVGDRIEVGHVVAEVETEKAVVEVPSPLAGSVSAIHVKAGDEVREGSRLLTVAADEGADKDETSRPSETASGEEAANPAARDVGEKAPAASSKEMAPLTPLPSSDLVAAAPSVRRLARELGIILGQVPGSGPRGRISEADVKAHARRLIQGGRGKSQAQQLPDFGRWGALTRQRLSPVRRATAHHLSASWPEVPQVTQFDRADVTLLEAARRQHIVEPGGAKVTPTAILLYVTSRLLRQWPSFRASLDLAAEELVVKESVHIGVAVDTERGLLVPVVRDADQKSLSQLARDLAGLSLRAREAKLGLGEMEGGVFTISNLGGIGGTSFTPVVNWPETAILGVSRTSTEPVWRDGTFVPRELMPLSLSYDHRVIDGAEAARFLRQIAERLEDPFHLMLEG